MNKYLEPSTYRADGGNLIGKLPSKLSVPELLDLGHPTAPIKAIRAKCVDCSGGMYSEVRKCVQHSCPLWPMRMGRNPFFGKMKDSDDD